MGKRQEEEEERRRRAEVRTRADLLPSPSSLPFFDGIPTNVVRMLCESIIYSIHSHLFGAEGWRERAREGKREGELSSARERTSPSSSVFSISEKGEEKRASVKVFRLSMYCGCSLYREPFIESLQQPSSKLSSPLLLLPHPLNPTTTSALPSLPAFLH